MSYLEHRPDHCTTAADALAAAAEVRSKRRKMYARVKQELSVPPKIEPPEIIPAVPNNIDFEIAKNHPLMVLVGEAQRFSLWDYGRDPTVREIQDAVCSVFGVKFSDLISARRTKDLTIPRHMSFVLCKLLTLRSLPDIGRRHGGRDHTTALHSIQKYHWLSAKLEAEGYMGKTLSHVAARAKELIEMRIASLASEGE